MQIQNKTAVVVLSGGQDSITCLGIALAGYQTVHAICFDYGQRHKIELDCAQRACDAYGVPLKKVSLGFLPSLVTSALTGKGDVSAEHPHKKGLPASFVPNRNAIFITLAHAHCQEVGAETMFLGVCQTDFSGYPDCRDAFIKCINTALDVGYETAIEIITPLMDLTKCETFQLAADYECLDMVLEVSHTCYNGIRNKHDWGYGCGECPACKLREKGYNEFIASLETNH